MTYHLERAGGSQESKVSVNVLRALVDTAEREGIPRPRLLAAAQRESGWIEARNSLVPRSELYRLCEAALSVSEDHTLALHWGTCIQDQAFNVVSDLVKYAPTLRHAFEALFRFSKLLADQAGTRLVEHGNRVTIQCIKTTDASFQVQRFMAEMTLVGLYRLVRSYSPSGWVERVCFEYAAPAYRGEYTRVFDGLECFEWPSTAIVFDRALMNAVSPYKDDDRQCVLHALAERRLMQITHAVPYAVRAREVLLRQPAPQRVSMSQVARELDMSVRSLRRRLVEEGKSYRELTHDACMAVAMRLIADERQTIQETAYTMGFADPNSFHRAFRRWTGTTPAQVRDHS